MLKLCILKNVEKVKSLKGEALLEQCKNTGACEKTNVKVHTHVYCNEHLVSKYH